MAEIQLLMPEMGESVTDATIIKWLKAEGEAVEADEDILEVATDKVDTEVPSPVSGVMGKILHQRDQVVEVGKPLAIIITSGDAEVSPSFAGASNTAPEIPIVEKTIMEEIETPQTPAVKVVAPEDFSSSDIFFSPLVKSIAKKEGISLKELAGIAGTGLEGRITKTDMQAYITNRGNEGAKQATFGMVETPKTTIPIVKTAVGDRVEDMDRMRKLIADHMIMSKQTSAHATMIIEADVTKVVEWRNGIKDEFMARENEKITFTPIFVEVVSRIIQEIPGINVSVSGHKIVHHNNINIGMATALPNGNLIVPVLKQTEGKSLLGLTKEVNDLASRARNGKLKPDETAGGTFTITNIGTFDNLIGTPIINQPQVAILAIGAIKKRPVVIEMPAGDMIGIRHMMYLSLSMDHRVVDGAMGGLFLKRIKDELEHWNVNKTI